MGGGETLNLLLDSEHSTLDADLETAAEIVPDEIMLDEEPNEELELDEPNEETVAAADTEIPTGVTEGESEAAQQEDGMSVEPGSIIDNVEKIETSDVPVIAEDAVLIDENSFPGGFFREYVKKFDADNDGMLSQAEANAVTQMNVFNTSCDNLVGIAYFPNLKTLKCGNSNLTELDLSNNKELIGLECMETPLTRLDLSSNTKLEYLYCDYNQLTELDLSGNKELSYLECSNNKLECLDLSNNTKLKTLFCAENQLAKLDTRKNIGLEYLQCIGNQLTELDVSGNTKLTELYCSKNLLMKLNINDNIESLDCSENQLTELNVADYTKLTHLECSENQLTKLELDNNAVLEYLDCGENTLTELDVSDNIALVYLHCNENNLTELDVSKNIDLEFIDCSENQLMKLDVSKNTHLDNLYCANNRLTELDVKQNHNLLHLNCIGQEREIQLKNTDDGLKLDMAELVGGITKLTRITELRDCNGKTLDMSAEGILLFPKAEFPEMILYYYETGTEYMHDISATPFNVTLHIFDTPEHVHSYVTVTSKEPTCTEEGLSYEECSECHEKREGSEKPIQALGHTGGMATCTAKAVCTRCGQAYGELAAHKYKATSKEASCTENGLSYEECSECHQKKAGSEKTIPALGHTGGTATCAAKAICTRCGQPYGELGTTHSFGPYSVTVEPTALAEGTETRTCTACGAKEDRAVAKLVATMEINVTSIKLKVKQSTTKVTVSNLASGDAVASWESSDPKIVMVNSNGKITAKLKKGKATVTVTLKSGLSKDIKVTVQKNAVACTKVTLNKKSITLKKGKTFTLKPTIKPITCIQKAKYTTSNKAVATVNSKGKIKAKKKGTATITVKVGKKKVKCKVKVK